MPIEAYVSYSPLDEKLVKKFCAHLTPHRQLITLFRDQFEPNETRIDGHLTTASLIVIALSADYLASQQLWAGEATQGLARHRAGAAQLILLRLRPTLLPDGDFAGVPILPRDGESLSTRKERDTAFAQAAKDLLSIAADISRTPTSVPAAVPSGARLHTLLCQLLPAQFAEIIYRLHIPAHVLPSEFAPQGMRAAALLQYAEQAGSIGHVGVWACIREIAPHLA